jgi:histidine kinase
MRWIPYINRSMIFSMIILVGIVLLVTISTWSYFNIQYQNESAIANIVGEIDRFGNTIKLGTHYAMMLNARDDITSIINNISRQEEIRNIRIYNKEGQIKFSNVAEEVDQITNIKADACYICHRLEPPLEAISLAERTRIFDSGKGYRNLGIISPIYNEPSCSTDSCHYHPDDKVVLGLLDVVVSLENTDMQILTYKHGLIVMAVVSFLGTSAIIGFFLMIFVNRPIKRLIAGTRLIGQGEYDHTVVIDREDEIGQLATAINEMGRQIGDKQQELNRQRDEYQSLFERVPCYITVQDRNLQVLKYNREITRNFEPQPGDFCYRAYKNRSEPCPVCPVAKTFETGVAHESEEIVVSKDGTESCWLVRTAPIRNIGQEIVAVMEMSLDITQLKHLENEIRRSEEKYHAIFNNIPNPVFVLDQETTEILDCNDSVGPVYGMNQREMLGRNFLDFFEATEREHYGKQLLIANIFNQIRQIRGDGKTIYVNVRVAPFEYLGRAALLVTTNDITKRLMAEQQLIQASKMATLGEMSAGVAHELNQPLSVIKTASNYLLKKARKKEAIDDQILQTMAEEIDGHVDRASKIINHLREFGRKADVKKQRVQVNEALTKALEIFRQQLKLREIEVICEFGPDIPLVFADPNRLEQVFINLLINARDAIEERCQEEGHGKVAKQIHLKTSYQGTLVTVEIRDTGTGIPDAILDKVFEPFFTTKKVGQGTGLGLSISYGIVQDYHGMIKVDTKVGEGSNFIVQFPVTGEH